MFTFGNSAEKAKAEYSKKAKLIIERNIVTEAYSMSGASYINGMCTICRDLGIITQNELAAYTSEAYKRAQECERKKREEYKAQAEQRKAERAEKAKAERAAKKKEGK